MNPIHLNQEVTMDVDPIVVWAILNGLARLLRAVVALVNALKTPARRKRK